MQVHRIVRWPIVLAVTIVASQSAALIAQSTSGPAASSRLKLETGKQIWDSGCVACHGPNGAGQSEHLAGFERPATFPDFTDCATSTVESDGQWRAIITNGGPARAFSEIMPSFKDLLTSDQITKVIEHIRSFCTEKNWPRGNLNLPRPMITEKAFPENETVITGSINGHGTLATAVIYEKRIGASGMVEAIVPFDFDHDSGSWSSAFGDLAIGYKQKLFHSLKHGSIASAGAELIAPTGDPIVGTGGDSTIFEPFVAFGQLLPADSFVQVHSGVELPAHPDKVPRAFYFRTAIGKTFSTDSGHGRRWSPMVEFIADRELVTPALTNWNVVPQIQIPMSRRMHILGNVGIRVPVNNTAGRPRQLMFYVLWDWPDGGLTEGW